MSFKDRGGRRSYRLRERHTDAARASTAEKRRRRRLARRESINLNHDARQRCANDDGDGDGDAVGETTTDGWKTHRRPPNNRCGDAADGGTVPSELFRPVHVVG